MSEKRYFKIEYDEEWYLFDSTTISEQLVKEQAEYGYGVFANSLSPSEVVDLLNEQQDTISQLQDLCGKSDYENAKLRIDNKKLKEENEQLKHYKLYEDNKRLQTIIADLKKDNKQLRQMIKENVFQQYREGSLADLEFKAIAYDDIINVKLSDESESKMIVICRQGKKENVKSFCQMFIPFGWHYEIKEVNE